MFRMAIVSPLSCIIQRKKGQSRAMPGNEKGERTKEIWTSLEQNIVGNGSYPVGHKFEMSSGSELNLCNGRRGKKRPTYGLVKAS